MAQPTHEQGPEHDPRAWDEDDNQPWLPKLPGPRTPQPGAQR